MTHEGVRERNGATAAAYIALVKQLASRRSDAWLWMRYAFGGNPDSG